MSDVVEPKVQTLEEVEMAHLMSTLKLFNGNKTKTAKALGITIKTLYNKLHRHGLFEASVLQKFGLTNTVERVVTTKQVDVT